MKLLLVEDDASMQATLQRALERRRIDVRVCGDGALALAQWQALEPDVVALDLSLPNVDGLQVLAAARAAGLRTPVLLLTARGTVGDRIVGLNAGADDYLPKPFDLDELEARLRALRRRHQSAAGEPPRRSAGRRRPALRGLQRRHLPPRRRARAHAARAGAAHGADGPARPRDDQGAAVRTGVPGRDRSAVRSDRGRRLPPAQEARRHRRRADDAARPGLSAARGARPPAA